MILFWLTLGILLVLAVLALAPPLLGRKATPGGDYTTANAAVFRDRLAELRQELEAGNLTEEAFGRAREELEHEFAREIRHEEATAPTQRSGGQGPLMAVAVLLPVLALSLYLIVGRPGLVVEPPVTRMSQEQVKSFAQMPVGQRISRLQAYLDKRPRAGDAWILLGSAYREREQFADAVSAYERARKLMGDQPQLLAQLAEAIAHANDRRVSDRARKLAEKALEQAPDNQLALWIAGSGAMTAGDREQAAELWRRLARQLPADSESSRMIRGYIAQAEGKQPSEVTIEGQGGSEKETAVSVKVSLAGDLKEKAEAGDTVFIFARAADGPPMPLAAIQRKVSDLPVSVTLSDAQAMMEGRSLSSADRVVIGARVTESGRPMAQSGDLEGTSEPLSLPTEGPVAITIDQQVP